MTDEDATSVMVGIINAMNAIPALKSAFDVYKKYVNTMKNLLTKNLNSPLVAMNGYLRGNTTKLGYGQGVSLHVGPQGFGRAHHDGSASP